MHAILIERYLSKHLLNFNMNGANQSIEELIKQKKERIKGFQTSVISSFQSMGLPNFI